MEKILNNNQKRNSFQYIGILTISSKQEFLEIVPIDPIRANTKTTIPIMMSRNEKDQSC